MRRSVTVVLTLLLCVLVTGLAAAVPHGSLQEATIAAHKRAYQPEEFDFLNDFGSKPDGSGDPGVDFGGDDDPGLDFGDDDPGLDFGDDDPGVDFGEEEEDWGFDFGD